MPCIINAANEVVVAGFLKGKIGFLQMSDIIETVTASGKIQPINTVSVGTQISGIVETDAEGCFDICVKATDDDLMPGDNRIFRYEVKASVTAMNGETQEQSIAVSASDKPFFLSCTADAEVKKERDSIMSMYMPYYAIDDSICEAMVASFERAYAAGLNKVVGEKVKNDIVRELRTVYGNGIISPLEMNKLMADSISRVYIVDGNSARVKQVRSFYSEKMAYELLVRSCRISPDAVQKCSLKSRAKDG